MTSATPPAPLYRNPDGTICLGGDACDGSCTLDRLAEATRFRDTARAAMKAAPVGSKAWRDAEGDLNFWQGKVAAEALSAALPADPFDGLS